MNAMLLHIPKGFTETDWKHSYIHIMPMGFFSIANYAKLHNHNVKIMNAAYYGNTEKALDIIFERIIKNKILVVGLSLHWHLSGYDVIQAIKIIKTKFPHIKTVIGGITASIYANEFMKKCDALDAVVQGEGEYPFTSYLTALQENNDLSSVHNLHWRKNSEISFNGLKYNTTQDEYSSFDFGINDTMFNDNEYHSRAMFDSINGKQTEKVPINQKPFFVNIGRGCSFNCIYCAGSKMSFKKYFNIQNVKVRNPESVVKTIQDAHTQGFRLFHVCFDPEFKNKDHYFESIFNKIKKEGQDSIFLYEAYALPSAQFIKNCSSTFIKTIMVLSPCFFKEQNMKKYKGYFFSEKDLDNKLQELKQYTNIETFVYFAITPLENYSDSDILSYVNKMKKIRDDFGCKVSAMPIVAEPGAPWLISPKTYGQNIVDITFDVFWKEWQKPLNKWNSNLCYKMQDVNSIFIKINSMMNNDILA